MTRTRRTPVPARRETPQQVLVRQWLAARLLADGEPILRGEDPFPAWEAYGDCPV
ncbi:hypothetical protein [Kitasatospora sp. NPDC015120]|uniref:hypothetical protein n=1 Tax=Kitasatospora sp. NPDC015120 TaxID=3364023 RepID=UPI0036F47549